MRLAAAIGAVVVVASLIPAVPAMAGSATAVSAGWEHTCALTPGGGAKCWGLNVSGQLGDTTVATRRTPVQVAGLESGVSAISAGGDQTCALTDAGGVKCWGYNGDGELGDGTTDDRHAPVDVSGLTSDVASVSMGGDHACAVTTAGGAMCWGFNEDGEVGDGSTTDRWVPVDVSGLTSGVAQIAAGDSHTCALTTGGAVKCWGLNDSGQVGDGTTTDRKNPAAVTGLTSGVAAIAAGEDHTCALTTAGGVKCWGVNDSGQVGDGTTSDRKNPVNVSGLTSGVAAIAVGGDQTCALTTGGGLKCWGDNEVGAVGDGTTTERHTPVDVVGLQAGVADVTGGGSHTCAMKIGGGLRCWGFNTHGQVGDGTIALRQSPVTVSGFSGPATKPKISKVKPAKGPVGATVKITGNNLLGATDVMFGTTPATAFSVESNTRIVVTVPAGATTGKIKVTTPSGSATSKKSFKVL